VPNARKTIASFEEMGSTTDYMLAFEYFDSRSRLRVQSDSAVRGRGYRWRIGIWFRRSPTVDSISLWSQTTYTVLTKTYRRMGGGTCFEGRFIEVLKILVESLHKRFSAAEHRFGCPTAGFCCGQASSAWRSSHRLYGSLPRWLLWVTKR